MNSSATVIVMNQGALVCRPVDWLDIVKFLVFNYLLHTLTVLSKPGDGTVLSSITRLVALFVPLLGTAKAIETIYRFARGEITPLKVALRARALCMIGGPVSELLSQPFFPSQNLLTILREELGYDLQFHGRKSGG